MHVDVQRIDHFSLTVADVQRSAAFYQRFGFEPVKTYVSTGPDAAEGTGTSDAEIEILWLQFANGGPMLELLRYVGHPSGPAAHNSVVGAAHMCLVVDDVRTAHAALLGEDVAFVSEPHEDEHGVVWVYMRDPDGNVLELIQDPLSVAAGNA